MLEKIISGGQTGADQAGLDVAIKFYIPHGGWIPKGRKTENGPLPLSYQLKEMDTDDYRERTHQNITDSHGTVIISRGALTGGSKLTQSYAKVLGRPNCYIDLLIAEEFEAAVVLKSFILENQIKILNVAGPRLSHSPWIYADVKTILETTLYLLFLDKGKDEALKPYLPDQPAVESFPETIDEAVWVLRQDFSLKTKTFIARQNKLLIQDLYFVFLDYIRTRLGFDTKNDVLLKDCSNKAEKTSITIEDAVMVIIKQCKASFEKDHLLRVVK